MTRRRFLRLTGILAVSGAAASGCSQWVGGTASTNAMGRTGRRRDEAFIADVEIDLRSVESAAPILSGAQTKVWKYEAELVKGDAAVLTTMPENHLGPILRVKKGQRVRVNYTNALPQGQPSIVHWHGLKVEEAMDGGPRYAVDPGGMYVYEFEVKNRAGTYWFHPHPHELTGLQVNNGMAGLFIVSDEEEAVLGLPSGEFDVPLVIQDRTFDEKNQFVYAASAAGAAGHDMSMMHGMHGSSGASSNSSGMMSGEMPGMMQSMMGFLGDRVLVNGRQDFVMPAATRAYRLRLLNGSNSRIYKLRWRDGSAMTVIGADGGLLEKPVTKPYVMLAPAERVELWVDFSGRRVGEEIVLESAAFDGAEDPGGMMGGMMEGASLKQGAAFPVLTVRVDRSVDQRSTLPAKLSTIPRLSAEDAANAARPRLVELTLNGMQWLINGRTYEMDTVLPEETVKFGATEVWEIVNKRNPGAMMDANGMAHPIHIHGVQFQVLERSVLPELKAGWDTVSDGVIDEGWKDTVLVMPGQRVKLAMTFDGGRGMYLVHCHNLEHESAGMMRNFRVE